MVKIKKENEEGKERKRKRLFLFFSLTIIKKINQITITPRQRRQKFDGVNLQMHGLPK